MTSVYQLQLQFKQSNHWRQFINMYSMYVKCHNFRHHMIFKFLICFPLIYRLLRLNGPNEIKGDPRWFLWSTGLQVSKLYHSVRINETFNTFINFYLQKRYTNYFTQEMVQSAEISLVAHFPLAPSRPVLPNFPQKLD